jgi:putative ABC transport system permease protein
MRRYFLAVSLAIRNLALHKMRAFLTVLGLIFGVSSVVAMLAIAEGASLEAQRQIAELGATNVILQSKKPIEEVKKSQGGNDNNFVFAFGLTHDDFDRIVSTIPTVVGATPIREFRQPMRHLDLELEGRVVGANPDCLRLTGQQMAQGRFLTDIDLHSFANVTVIGSEVAEKLFPFGDPVGKSIRIGDQHYYEIIGVTAHKAPSAGTGSSLAAQDFNKDAYIPISTDRVRFGDVIANEKQGSFSAEKIELSQITVAVDEMDNVKRTSEALESLLGQFHPKHDYSVTVPLELLEKAEATKRIFNLVLGTIASISLLVGGIGIMNIMLATVTERTREIGIRRALGAKRRDITEQFLIETVVLSGVGGMLGVVIGIGIPQVIKYFVADQKPVVTGSSVLLAFSISVGIGILFGLYPARRAALMDPIEALRHE